MITNSLSARSSCHVHRRRPDQPEQEASIESAPTVFGTGSRARRPRSPAPPSPGGVAEYCSTRNGPSYGAADPACRRRRMSKARGCQRETEPGQRTSAVQGTRVRVTSPPACLLCSSLVLRMVEGGCRGGKPEAVFWFTFFQLQLTLTCCFYLPFHNSIKGLIRHRYERRFTAKGVLPSRR